MERRQRAHSAHQYHNLGGKLFQRKFTTIPLISVTTFPYSLSHNSGSHNHHHGRIGSPHTHTSTLPQARQIQHPISLPGESSVMQNSAEEEAESTLSNLLTNFNRSMLYFGRLTDQESNSSKRAQSIQTSSDASTVNSDPVFRNLPGNYSQISAATNSSGTGSSVDLAHLLLQVNITSSQKY